MSLETEGKGLCAILRALSNQHGRYLELALEQRSALVENRVGDLTEIMQKMEILADAVLALESRRASHMEVMAEECEIEAKTIADLLPYLSPALALNMQKEVAVLKERVRQCQLCNRINETLLNSARTLVKVSMEALFNLAGDPGPTQPRHQIYCATGTYENRGLKTGLLNRRG